MAPHFLCLAAFLPHLLLAQTKPCKNCEVSDDATVLMQRSLTPRKRSKRSPFLAANARKRTSFIELARSRANLAAKAIVRPSAGKGPDIVTFGMQPKAFYGMDMQKNTFTMDLVITLEWMDKRTVSLIPKGASNLTLSAAEANKFVWLPQVSVTNRDVGKIDTISTAVMLHKTGKVVKVLRVMTTVKETYDVSEYPYDEQDLLVKIASTQYMLNEVKLKPDASPEFSGAHSSVMDGGGFSLAKWKVYVFEDVDGLLQKSRGIISITMSRSAGGYMQNHVIPAAFIITLSCLVFWLPFTQAFVTPRLAASIISLITFTKMAAASDKPLPPGHTATWNDVFNQNVQILMSVVAVYNIYTEIKHHVTKVPDVANKINGELRMIMPGIFFVVCALILMVGGLHGSKGALDWTMKILLVIFCVGYSWYCEKRVEEGLSAKAEAEPLKS